MTWDMTLLALVVISVIFAVSEVLADRRHRREMHKRWRKKWWNE